MIVFIDLNNDGVFDDNTELLYTSSTGNPTTRTFNVLIPTIITTGSHRMRIITVRDNYSFNGTNTCFINYQLGES